MTKAIVLPPPGSRGPAVRGFRSLIRSSSFVLPVRFRTPPDPIGSFGRVFWTRIQRAARVGPCILDRAVFLPWSSWAPGLPASGRGWRWPAPGFPTSFLKPRHAWAGAPTRTATASVRSSITAATGFIPPIATRSACWPTGWVTPMPAAPCGASGPFASMANGSTKPNANPSMR
jgi:hypothetical protein